MNDFSDFEAELRQLRPRPVSPELVSRIEIALAQKAASIPTAAVLPRQRKLRFSWLALSFGAAAVAGLVMVTWLAVDPNLRRSQQPVASLTTPAPENARSTISGSNRNGSFVPDGLTRVVYNRHDEGLVYPRSSSAPVRRVRSRARETLHWKEPGTGASLRVSYPTDEVELIPVSGQ